MARRKDIDWDLDASSPTPLPVVHAALLMDIRDELKQLNRVLGCSNFADIPRILRRIRANTDKRRRRKGASPR